MAGHMEMEDRRDPQESAILDQESLDPEMHYRFFNTSQTRIARARALGYRVVKRSDGVLTLWDQEDDDSTDTIVHGDRVLMMIPKEKYDTRRRRKSNIARERLSGPARSFRSKARRAGVTVAEDNLGHKSEPTGEEE